LAVLLLLRSLEKSAIYLFWIFGFKVLV